MKPNLVPLAPSIAITAPLTIRLGATRSSLWLLAVACVTTISLRAADVAVVTSPDASSAERVAVQDLLGVLRTLHPQDRFVAAGKLPAAGQAVLIGAASDKLVRPHLDAPPNAPESFVVRHRRDGALELGVIAGADPRGTVHGVYALLEKLGCGFCLTGDTLPPVRDTPFSFDGWELADQPLVAERLVFNWHNFLSGCSTWNLADWQRWTAQSQKMGYNAIMVHAYGNNPMAEFAFQGVSKPVGYLSTTIKGRDWSTMHVTDARRLYGGEAFNAPAFGADAGLVPDEERVAAAKSLMQNVFADAARRDMGVYFAVDVDTPSANPQELVSLLPESARFPAGGATSTMTGSAARRIWLPNPDTPEGYAFLRAQVAGLLKTYPQITRLVVWFRRDSTPWVMLKVADLPAAWQQEYAAEIARTPGAERYWRAPGLFAVSKIVRAFERALKDCNATRTSLAAGTWGFEFLPAADRFFPSGVPLIGLDYDVIHEKPQLGETTSRSKLREIGVHRPVIPVVWAHHDDGHYIGRPYTPLPEFASKLDDAKAKGFGIIHWTTRPLDLYFSSLACQVWKSTKDQPLRETCGNMAERWYGSANRVIMGEYLESWITGAPRFGRDTSDWFIDRKLTDIAAVITGCRARLAMIDRVQTTGLLPEQRQRLDYQRGLEEFIAAFHVAHGQFQDSQDMLKSGDPAGATTLISQCHPEEVIKQFARFSSIGGITRGEQGLLVSLNTRWLSHIVRHRQALRLEPVRINFAPTSHDKLAQARGTFTFHFGPDHELWECLGEEETGATAFTLPISSVPTNGAPAPAAWSEIGLTGIEINKPLQLALRPIMAASNQGRDKAVLLSPGAYRLHLLVRDPDFTAPGQRLLDVAMADIPTDRVDVFEQAGRTNRMVDLTYSVALKSAGALEVTITPVKGKAVLCGVVLEPIGSAANGGSGTEPFPKNGKPGNSVKVFVLAGDENMLRQGSIDGIPTEPQKKKPADRGGPVDKPGTLLKVIQENPRYAFLKDAAGRWTARSDVALYDAHPLSNNTRDPARLLQVPSDPEDPRGFGVGVERMLGQVIGEKLDDPVLLIRFATKHPIWFRRGSRSLGYDFLSPSGGGGLDLDGGWDVIHFNHGVWDQATLDPKNGQRAEPGKGVIRISIGDYEKNLRTIVARLKQTKATLIWASTTPILVGSPPGYAGGEMVDKYNAVAAKVMRENGVIIDDLNAECRRMGKPKALNVHDVGDLAPRVTESILAALKARQNPSRPLPRVLFIGDSITGTYWEKVQKNLDGKAFVAKNPGNGEHSGTGARLVNQWVDLKQYLLNGQEYLELIDGVKQTLKDFDRYCPDFAGRTPKLAGFVWFQGIADAQSDAFSSLYEKHLTGFIRDVRREFGTPELPFVIAALGQYGEKMQPNTRKVHDAQMAVAKTLSTVASIDTIPFYFPPEKSPGGREWDYQNNAESFLLIGEAMGKGMDGLLKNQ